MRHRLVVVLLASLLLGGCVSFGPSSPEDKRKPEQELAMGIRLYEDGNYKAATAYLQNALANGLNRRADQVAARKYLAFIHCASEREKACREEFRKAFELDPGFELSPAEQGHPLWGPVYGSVRASLGGKARGR